MTAVERGDDRIASADQLPTPQDLKGDYLQSTSSIAISEKKGLGPGSSSGVDRDESLLFQMRGHSLNPLVDAAQSLLGMVIRLRRLDDHADVPTLYASVRDQITALSEEVRQLGYDGATQLAYRYALCAFIDEAVMLTSWGRHSSWSTRSLLSYHHNETWAGEKFFTVLARMQMDPEKYRDVLEFKYLCLCLGFQGKFGQQPDTLNALITKLRRTLRPLRGDAPEQLTAPPAEIVSQRFRLKRQLPLWTPWAVALVVLAGAYTFFSVQLASTTELVLQSLDSILQL